MTAKIFKPIICAFIIISLLLGVCFTASAAGTDGHITVSTVTAVNGDSVIVRLKMENNPGIMAITISVTYDSSVLTYERYYEGYLWDYTVADHPDKNLIRFVNCENGNERSNGTMIAFKFKVKEDADFGFYPIGIEYKQGDFCNWKLQKLMPEVTSGGVNIEYNGKNCSHKKYGEWETVAPPKCETAGARQHACVKCGHIEIKDIAPTGHDFSDEWTVDEPATKEKEGKMSRHCKNCSAATDLLTFTLDEAEKNGIDNKASGGVKPSKFTDKLKEEQLPEEETKPDNNSGSGDNSNGSTGGVLDSLPVESGSAAEKLINGLPDGIKRLEKLFIGSFFIILKSFLIML